MLTSIPVIDLGRMKYAAAYQRQLAEVDAVLASRESGKPEAGRLLLVEHDPVITISRRKEAREHLLATAEMLARAGVELAETDRGGDITYHGPGQLVVYPILDLNRLNLGLHAYMRLLEQAIIDACGEFGVTGFQDPAATGVWVAQGNGQSPAKLCAMGVRIRRWVTMHGLALNVSPNLRHFGLIVPCGLAGRGVTSLEAQASGNGGRGPSMERAKAVVSAKLCSAIQSSATRADEARAAKAGDSHVS